MFANALLAAAGGYLLCGGIFAIPFAWFGAGKMDPHAAKSSWGFRMFLIPGAVLLWPWLARRWATGVTTPPEEKNPHRIAARAKEQK